MNGRDITADTLEHDAIMRWRKSERQRLMAERLSTSVDARRRHARVIGSHLSDALGSVQGRTVGVYWPFRGEPNLRAWMEQIHAQGARCALPVGADANLSHRADLNLSQGWKPILS